MTRPWYGLAFGSLFLAACATEPSSTDAAARALGDTVVTPPAVECEEPAPLPGHGPTLLVLNASCSTGQCIPMDIRAGDPRANFPGGSPSFPLGRVCGASACLRFPEADTVFSFTGNSSGELVDTTLLIWTPSLTVGVGAYKVGGGFLGMGMLGRVGQFIPGSSPGWQVTLPVALPGWASAVAASPCNPL